MRSILMAFAFLLSLNSCSIAQTDTMPSRITDLESADQITQNGDLSTGEILSLDFADNSDVACFPATRFYEFQGKHVFYRVDIPPKSVTTFTVSPKNKKDRINIYGFRMKQGSDASPPNISNVSCEAAYPKYVGTPKLSRSNKAQSIEFAAIQKSYTILIGVAGAKGVESGEFTLDIHTKR